MLRSLSRLTLACGVLAAGLVPATAHAQFADLQGRITFVGDDPQLPVKVTRGDAAARDAAVCAAEEIRDYRLTINPENKGVADVFIYLRRAPDKIKPELMAVPQTELVVDQKLCQFIPHAMIVRCNQQIIAKSQDAVSHNVHPTGLANSGCNLIVPPNEREGVKLPIKEVNSRPDSIPLTVKCDIHPHMEAFWLVQDHPYMAVTDADGNFKIEGLPVGKHSFTVWHSTSGYIWNESRTKPEMALVVDVTADGAKLDLKVESQTVGGRFKLVSAK